MTKNMNSGHGMTGMHLILKKACHEMRQGTCKEAGRQSSGTIEHTFGRLYNPSKSLPDVGLLKTLSEKMVDDESTVEDGPAEAGMAFLGQFIDHDLTLDATTELGKAIGDVEKIRNFRTPRLDLDCVYGSGPEVTPHLYDGPKLIHGRLKDEVHGKAENPLDLYRTRTGRALIGDPRNDENLFVSQLQSRMFISQHNQLVDDGSGDADARYEHAKERMIKTYHEDIVGKLLRQIVNENVLQPLLENASDAAGRGQNHLSETANIDWSMAPDLPVEFSAAAFRFGHSMIRQTYKLNQKPGREAVPIFAQPGDPDAVDLKGFSPVNSDNNLDMDLFFGESAQRARPIDTRLPPTLLNLPTEIVGDKPNLAFRNMERGQITFELPSGEVVAKDMGFPIIEPDPKLGDLEGNTPLWFYILSEAEQSGGQLGSVGGTLVAGVLLNLLLRGNSPYFFGKSGKYA